MGKKPLHMGIGSREPAFGTMRSTLAELEVDGLGNIPIERDATVGRSPGSHVVLNVPSVSRHHARIFYEGGHFWIKDLDSGNGTTVNGKKITLQMLSDSDKLCFGEASAIFHTSTKVPGPAPLAHDPLEGSDGLPQDGTPTGGLQGPYPTVTRVVHDANATIGEPAAPGGTVEDASALRLQVHNLERDNSSLRSEIEQLRSADLAQENARLRKLVAQLERALSDSNIRLRNLQQRLDE